MSVLLLIICLLIGLFTFFTILYIYFSYTSKPSSEEVFFFESHKNGLNEKLYIPLDGEDVEDKVA